MKFHQSKTLLQNWSKKKFKKNANINVNFWNYVKNYIKTNYDLKKNFNFIFIQKTSNLIKKFRKIVNFEMSSNAIVMNIKFQKQTYIIIINIFFEFAFFYSAFAVKLIGFKLDSKINLHKNSFLIEFRYWK